MPADESNDSGRSPWTLSAWERLSQTFVRPPQGPQVLAPSVDVTRMSDEEKRAFITRLDPLERKVGLAAAAFGALITLVVNLAYMFGHISQPASGVSPKKGHCPTGLTYVKGASTCNTVYPASHYVLPLVLGLVFSIGIYVTVRIGRRAPVAFMSVLTGLSLGFIELIPFALVAGWILLRAYRAQKYGGPTAKVLVPGWIPPPKGQGRGRSRASGPPSKSKSAASGQNSQRKPPPPNKRYTPKAPPKKRPAPVPARPANKSAPKAKGRPAPEDGA